MELASGHLTVKPAVRRRRPSHRQPIDVAVRGQGAATEQRPTFHRSTVPPPNLANGAANVDQRARCVSKHWTAFAGLVLHVHVQYVHCHGSGWWWAPEADRWCVGERVCGAVESTVAEPSSAFRLDAAVTREHDGCCHWGKEQIPVH